MELNIANERSKSEARRANVNFIVYKANEAIDRNNDKLKGLEILQAAWKENPNNAEILETFYKAVPYDEIPNSLHHGPVRATSFSPDGKLIITASDDKTVKVVTAKGVHILTLDRFKTAVQFAAFSPDGKTILTLNDFECRLWTLDGKELPNYNTHLKRINSAAFSPDGKTILTASDDYTVRLWSIDGKKSTTFIGHEGAVTQAIFSKDGSLIATSSNDGTAKLWSLKGENTVSFIGHKSRINYISFSPEEKFLLTVAGDENATNSDNTAILWNLLGDSVASFNGHTDALSIGKFSPQGEIIATGSFDSKVILWDYKGKIKYTSKLHSSKINDIKFSKDGKWLLTSSVDKKAKLWNIDGDELATFAHSEEVCEAVFSPDGNSILTASVDQTYKLWDLGGGELPFILKHKGLIKIAVFSPDGTKALSTATDNKAILWNLVNGTSKELNHTDAVIFGCFSTDGKLIVTTSGEKDKSVKVWDDKGNKLAVLDGHEAKVNYAVFSHDFSRVLTASDDGTVKEWDWYRNKCINTIRFPKGVLSAQYLKNSTEIICTCRDKKVRRWQNNKQEEVVTIVDMESLGGMAVDKEETHFLVCEGTKATLRDESGKVKISYDGHASLVNSALFSSDYTKIITTSDDNTIKIWEIKGKLLLTLEGHQAGVNYASFSPNGSSVISASSDGTLRVWHINPADVFGLKK